MAITVVQVKVRVCDTCGTEVGDDARFTVRGRGATAQVDLCDRHATAMLAVLGVKAPRRKRRKGPTAAQVREWAADNGMHVSVTGRVPQAVIDAYSAAQ